VCDVQHAQARHGFNENSRQAGSSSFNDLEELGVRAGVETDHQAQARLLELVQLQLVGGADRAEQSRADSGGQRQQVIQVRSGHA
jgi:hypothetical protein